MGARRPRPPRPRGGRPRALTCQARSGSASQASTAVQAAACTTRSGRRLGHGRQDRVPVAHVELGAVGGDHLVVGARRPARRTRSVPSWPPAPVIRIFTRAAPGLAPSAAPTTSGCPGTSRRWPRGPRRATASAPSPSARDLGRVDGSSAGRGPRRSSTYSTISSPGPGQGQEPLGEVPVGQLVAGPDVVDLARLARPQHRVDGGAVVLDVEPVPLVEPVAVQRAPSGRRGGW